MLSGRHLVDIFISSNAFEIKPKSKQYISLHETLDTYLFFVILALVLKNCLVHFFQLKTNCNQILLLISLFINLKKFENKVFTI